jgi:DNA polymerase III sliding clamp (beta) subunit (PCNA family)
MKLKDLRLALNATPKKPDIRYYLNGLNITGTHVSGSNGHVLCHINTYTNEIPKDHDSIIIPVETIKALLKKVGTKHDHFEVCIFLINEQYQLQCMNQVEVFKPIDHKYPEFKKIIEPLKLNDHDKNLNAICHQFDWAYVALANAALCIYFGNTTPKRLYSFELAGYMMPSDEVIYVIMPCRL